MNNQQPLVSILMGIYNCELYLTEAIQSILNQTYSNWEFIICDDGSSDHSFQIAKSFQSKHPEKFILLQNEKNSGLPYTLNHCFRHANGSFIARMDGDDFSLPERLEKQVSFLQSHPQYALVSCHMIFFDESGDWSTIRSVENPQKKDFLSPIVFGHAPVMMRREAFQEVQGYSEEKFAVRVEDLHLWLKFYEKGYIGYNIQSPLFKVRDNRDSCGRRKYHTRINEFYVRFLAMKKFKLGIKGFLYALKPLLVGLLPLNIYVKLRKRKLSKPTSYIVKE